MRLRSVLMVCTSEFIGTAIFLCVGCAGTAGLGSVFFLRTMCSISICFGFAMLIAVHTFGPISGGHVNPSVTIAAVLMGNLDWKIGCLYVLFQCLGGLAGFAVLYMALPAMLLHQQGGLCTAVPSPGVDLWQTFLVEFFLTAVLIYFYVAVWNKHSNSTLDSVSVRLGFVFSVLIASGLLYTGPSLNFARSLPPALFLNIWTDFWIYPLGQLLASIVVPFAWKFLHTTGNGESKGEGEAVGGAA